MKNITLLEGVRALSIALIACFVVSCAKFDPPTPSPDPSVPGVPARKDVQYLTSSLEQPAETKMKLSGTDDDGYRLEWESGDKIAVLGYSDNTSVLAPFTLESGAGDTRGTFSGTLPSGCEEMYAVFPNSNNNPVLFQNALSFDIPKTQAAVENNFGKNVMPSVAKLATGEDGPKVDFHNVLSLLRITLKSDAYVKIKRIVLHDLGGNMLWGRCTIPIIGGVPDYENPVISGGDNTLILEWNKYSAIGTSSNKSFYFSVPPGSLDKGFSLVIYEQDESKPDGVGRAYTFLQKITDTKPAVRSNIHAVPITTITEKSEPYDVADRGYYKKLFIDAGTSLNNYYNSSDIPALDDLELEGQYEYLATNTRSDTQSELLACTTGDDVKDGLLFCDSNGVLLYPDGEPRFKSIFVNGGDSEAHGKDLGSEGRSRFHDFFVNGGSYVGACAGAILACSSVDGTNCYDSETDSENYTFGLWPGNTAHTGWPRTYGTADDADVYTGMIVLEPLAAVSSGALSEDQMIYDVRHHGGVYVGKTELDKYPDQCQRLANYRYTPEREGTDIPNECRYNDSTKDNQYFQDRNRYNYCSTWSYKADESTGRAVLCGSHFERASELDQLHFFDTMLNYALDGTGAADVKGDLEYGQTWSMDKFFEDDDPSHTAIGDRQYHHFRFVAEEDLENVCFELISNYESDSGIDLYFGLRKGGLAWLSDADYTLCNKGGKKRFTIKHLPAGEWYLSVYCATTVTATPSGKTMYYFTYSGKTEVLDGIPYSVMVGLDGAGGTEDEEEL